jgi:HemY protein
MMGRSILSGRLMIRALSLAFRLGLVAVVVAAIVWLGTRPGVVELHWLHYDIHAAAGLAFTGLFVAAILVILAYRVLSGIFSFPRRFRKRLEEQRREKGFRSLTLGLTAIAAGDEKLARYHAYRARRFLPEDKGLSILLEGQAARLSGDDEASRRAFQSLMTNQDTAFLGMRGLLVSALESGDLNEAGRIVREARALHPRQPWLIRMAYDLDVRQAHWREALDLLDQAEAQHAADAATERGDRAVLLCALADEEAAGSDKSSAMRHLQQAHRIDPGFVPAAQRLAQYYLEQGSRSRALAVIEETWAQQPHPDLVLLWRDAAPAKSARDSAARMRWFERLVALKPDSAEGQMAAAGEALEQGLYGICEQYLDRADEIRPHARLYRMRSRLAQACHRPEEATFMLRKAAEAPADKTWYCTETGRIYDRWMPLAPPHGSFNTIVWGIPRLEPRDRAIADRSELLVSAPMRK